MYYVTDQDAVLVVREAASAAARGVAVDVIVGVVEQLRNGDAVAEVNARLAAIAGAPATAEAKPAA